MATIQIRDVPDEAHRQLVRLAQEAGQSLQAYMRRVVLDVAAEPAARIDAIHRLEGFLMEYGGVGATAEEIVADVHAERR